MRRDQNGNLIANKPSRSLSALTGAATGYGVASGLSKITKKVGGKSKAVGSVIGAITGAKLADRHARKEYNLIKNAQENKYKNDLGAIGGIAGATGGLLLNLASPKNGRGMLKAVLKGGAIGNLGATIGQKTQKGKPKTQEDIAKGIVIGALSSKQLRSLAKYIGNKTISTKSLSSLSNSPNKFKSKVGKIGTNFRNNMKGKKLPYLIGGGAVAAGASIYKNRDKK